MTPAAAFAHSTVRRLHASHSERRSSEVGKGFYRNFQRRWSRRKNCSYRTPETHFPQENPSLRFLLTELRSVELGLRRLFCILHFEKNAPLRDSRMFYRRESGLVSRRARAFVPSMVSESSQRSTNSWRRSSLLNQRCGFLGSSVFAVVAVERARTIAHWNLSLVFLDWSSGGSGLFS